MLRCGQNEIRMRSAHGSYMKRQPPRQPQQSRPPTGNRNRTIELSTVPVRAHCPSGGGGIIPFPIFVVSVRTCRLQPFFQLANGKIRFIKGGIELNVIPFENGAMGGPLVDGGFHPALRGHPDAINLFNFL